MKTRSQKILSMLLLLALAAVIALFAIGCNDNTSDNGDATSGSDVTTTSDVTETPSLNVKGEGNTEFIFKVVTASGETKTFTVKTDKTTVGEALLDAGLIAGDEGDFGLYVKTVDGETLDYDKDGMYWSFYVGDGYALKGVDSTEIESGVEYSFRAAKG